MLKKNDIVCAVTEAMGSGGEGIIRHEGITFFVPSCLPGEKVRFKVLKRKDKIGYGKIEEVLTPAEERVRPKCPVYSRCGGCCLQHLDYPFQLIHKSKTVQDALRKIGGLDVAVPLTVKSDRIYGYRNKLQLPIGIDEKGETVLGFYAERSHRIIPVTECAIHPEWSTALIAVILRFCRETQVKGYDERTKTGLLRHIVARELNGNFIFTLVATKKDVPLIGYLVELLSEKFPSFTLYINVNDKDTNVILGEEMHLVHGNGFFEGTEQGIRYEAGPITFLQVNDRIREKLYKEAVKSVARDGDEVIIDAYSGGGLMTAMLAQKAKRVYGIELVEEATACAVALKEKNGLQNMFPVCGAVEDELPKILQKEKDEKLRLILDPPRAGIARSVLKALLDSQIPALTLISCNPATLARDLGILTGRLIENEKGELVKNPDCAGMDSANAPEGFYTVTSVQPWDMFPQTKHVETLVVLALKR